MAKDGAGGDEARQRVAQALVADVELGAELGAAERAAGTSEEIEHAAIDLARRFELGGPGDGDDGEVGVVVVARDELKAKRIGRRGGAMLDREQQGVLLSSEVEIGVALLASDPDDGNNVRIERAA